MSQNIIADNWSLQELSELFSRGFSREEAPRIVPEIHKDRFRYDPVAGAIVQTEALFDFLTDLVLRNQIIVDEAFTEAWFSDASTLSHLINQGIVRTYAFLRNEEVLDSLRAEFVDKLCVTSDLREAQLENEKTWRANREIEHPALSTILWGGAGMLARGCLAEFSYTPHPLRRRLLQDTGLISSADATGSTVRFIQEKRAMLARGGGQDEGIFRLDLHLNPIPLIILMEAKTPQDILPVALQVRDEYAKLRGWLGEFQNVYDHETLGNFNKWNNILRSISDHVDHTMGVDKADGTSFSASMSFLSLSTSYPLINKIMNSFGVRATINKLIFGPRGKKEMDHFLDLFGERRSKLGLRLRQHFLAQD